MAKVIEQDVVTLFAESDGKAGYLKGPWDASVVDGTGRIRVEMQAECVQVVHHPDSSSPRMQTKKLQCIQDIYNYSYQVEKKFFILAEHKTGLSVSKKVFDTQEDACGYLKNREGEWIILRKVNYLKMLPLPDNTDPFSNSIPVEGSFIVNPFSKIYGPFLCHGLSLQREFEIYNWIMFFCGSGYFVTKVLERCELIDGTPSEPVNTFKCTWNREKKGDYFVFEKYSDDSVRLVLVTPKLEVARQRAKTEPGCRLIAKWLYSEDMH